MLQITIRKDDLQSPQVHALLQQHLDDMQANTPPESVHALDLDSLRATDLTFWCAWHGVDLLGCGALKNLGAAQGALHGELKSMRTDSRHIRKGVGQAVLTHIIEYAKGAGYKRLSLETGHSEPFKPALSMYRKHGFTACGPFDQYVADPFSVFLTREL